MARHQYSLKLVIDVETTKTRAEVLVRLDQFFSLAQDILRRTVLKNFGVTIVGWHYHSSNGTVDEIEP